MRLIDADRLKRQVEGRSYRAKGKFIEMIDAAPTIETRPENPPLEASEPVYSKEDGLIVYTFDKSDFMAALEEEIRRPRGRWEIHEDASWAGGGFTKCSACGYGFAWGAFFEVEEWEFCPICGAMMDLKGEPHEQN